MLPGKSTEASGSTGGCSLPDRANRYGAGKVTIWVPSGSGTGVAGVRHARGRTGARVSASAIRVSSRRTITSICFSRPMAFCFRLRRRVSGRSWALVMLITAQSARRACSRP